ncbi:peptidase domain-containing ABC transporter, partial [bacterium]|nr:peptidase domain-containing ABC transporter [bacterium]
IEPFSKLSKDGRELLKRDLRWEKYKIGERIYRQDEMPNNVNLIINGEARLLAESFKDKSLITLKKIGEGSLIGWAGLLRGEACETVQASKDVESISIPSEVFVRLILTEANFREYFSTKSNIHESWIVFKAYLEQFPYQNTKLDEIVMNACSLAKIMTNEDEYTEDCDYILSTAQYNNKAGSRVSKNTNLVNKNGFVFEKRIIKIDKNWKESYIRNSADNAVNNSKKNTNDLLNVGNKDLFELGILEADSLTDKDQYPILKGRGMVEEGIALVEMVARRLDLPMRKELCKKFLQQQEKRGKNLGIENLGSLCEGIGCLTQIGVIVPEHLRSVDFPAIEINENYCRVHWAFKNGQLISSDSKLGLVKEKIEDREKGKNVRLLILKKSPSAANNTFGWKWFVPLIIKYKWALILVFAATMVSQLMNLAIPLLLQQIIDKVLSQGNTSTLNVLGGTMVILALCSGLLTAFRQFIFVDTTDRMDLTLGSSVIDRLLSLPLRYFEKRPVGELSQRLGELNNIRGFLTGTALISVMNVLFALMYLVVMIIYSPLLTAVALSTFPIYAIMIFVISPIFKSMIRKKAVAQARTQSHLIEILTGIQTVKAQNSQLTSRWKWQDRYKDFVNQGFRAVTVGTFTSQTGSFLTQLSGLMIIWVGMIEILNGNLSLGQLIAFRIISSNVTGPLLQLSTLWQGFQGVQLSMERLGDILNQVPEQTVEETSQVALPPIQGNIQYEDVSFRFGESGPYQINNVNLRVNSGEFIGIVGQSGSGKSTLMKLLPRLYRINKGRIFIDGYDIQKVELSSLRRQIGMVPQDSLLFEGTVAENISLNDPTADDISIIRAATIACAHEFIMELPQGYATRVAERGSNLSGGQRQRIAIARTILDNPKMLIMDEATSALDYETERMVCINIQEWAKEKTVLFITHRLNTIKSADKIVLMNKGIIAETGSHDELIRQNGRYKVLFEQQGIAEGM